MPGGRERRGSRHAGGGGKTPDQTVRDGRSCVRRRLLGDRHLPAGVRPEGPRRRSCGAPWGAPGGATRAAPRPPPRLATDLPPVTALRLAPLAVLPLALAGWVIALAGVS